MSLINFTQIEIKENNDPMVDLSEYPFILEPKYFQQGLSDDARMFLRKETVKKLLNVQKILGEYRLKIWDGYRSRKVQGNIYKKFWNEFKKAHPNWSEDELKLETGKFVTPSDQIERIPPHATGGTVDLTLVDENGRELDMGTEFDFFGPETAPFHFEIYRNKPEIATNRKLLREAMIAEDFTLDGDEWWHFDWRNQMWALKSGKPFAFYGEAKV